MAYAEVSDVELVSEGPPATEKYVQYLIDASEARLDLLMPDLAQRASEHKPVELLARDVVVQAVLRRMRSANGPEVRSETQGAGPYSSTVTYHSDRTRTFSDQDLELLSGRMNGAAASIGTIRLGLSDWNPPAGRRGVDASW